MSSRIVSSFWNEHASATLPGTRSSSQPSTRSAVHCSTSGGSKKHLLQGVAAQSEPKRLERDYLLRRDVAEVDRRAELLDEPDLRRLRRRLEHHVLDADRTRDLAD